MGKYSVLALIATGIIFFGACSEKKDQKKEKEVVDNPFQEESQKMVHLTSGPTGTEKSDKQLKAYQSKGVNTEAGVPEALKVGDRAPNFNAVTTSGEQVQLSEVCKNGPVVVFFYRGEWCPVCDRYLSKFNDSLQLVLATGAQVLAITPEVQASAVEMKEKTGADFPIVLDEGGKIMDAFGVGFTVTDAYVNKIDRFLNTSIADNNGTDEARLPVPATFIIAEDGTIGWVQFDVNYKNRASISKIIEEATKIPRG